MQGSGRMGHAKTAKIRRNLTGLVASESRYGQPRASNPSKGRAPTLKPLSLGRARGRKKNHPSS